MSRDPRRDATGLILLFDEATAMLKVLERAAWNDPSGCPVCGGKRTALPIDRYEWHTDDCRLASLLMRIDQSRTPSA